LEIFEYMKLYFFEVLAQQNSKNKNMNQKIT